MREKQYSSTDPFSQRRINYLIAGRRCLTVRNMTINQFNEFVNAAPVISKYDGGVADRHIRVASNLSPSVVYARVDSLLTMLKLGHNPYIVVNWKEKKNFLSIKFSPEYSKESFLEAVKLLQDVVAGGPIVSLVDNSTEKNVVGGPSHYAVQSNGNCYWFETEQTLSTEQMILELENTTGKDLDGDGRIGTNSADSKKVADKNWILIAAAVVMVILLVRKNKNK